MHGLPIQQLPKTQAHAKAHGLDESKGKGSAKAEAGVQVEGAGGDFSSLFASMTGKEAQKPSDVKSETGETLKNLLAEKHSEKVGEQKIEGKVLAKPGQAITSEKKSSKLEQATGEMVAKTGNNLDLLLNSLKGTQDLEDSQVEENGKEDSLKGMRSRKGEPVKGELKSETPLDFLMKGAKGKGVTEQTTSEMHKEIENPLVQKKVVTGEDYLKNMQAAEKKAHVLAVINGRSEIDQNNGLPKNHNVKGYGQGMNLLTDPLIRNTKDLSDKDIKKGKTSIAGVDVFQAKETKVGAELSLIKQDAVPAVQAKNNHGQSELQTQSNQKVLDLSSIHTSNTNEIIKKISDYVEQNQVANKQSLDLKVVHESLGEFKIQVSKMPDTMNRGLNQIDMQITTSSKEGHDFFVKNEVSLMKNLNQAGINLSDLRIVSSMSESTPFGQSDSRQSSSFQQGSDGSRQFSSFESSSFAGNSSDGSDNGTARRKELWEEYQQRYGA